MKLYRHKQTNVLMSEHDYNHLSSNEQQQMEIVEKHTFIPNKTSRTENGLVDTIIGVNGRTPRFKSGPYYDKIQTGKSVK